MKLRKVVLIILSLGIIYATVFSSYGLVKIVQLKVHIWQTEEETKVMEARGVLIKYELHLLENNPDYVKKIGMEKFGMQ